MVHRMSAAKILSTFSASFLLVVFIWTEFSIKASQAQRGNLLLEDQDRLAENLDGVILPFDRNLSRGMQRARQRIAAGEYTQAIRFLDKVLRQEQDSFLEMGNTGEHAGLKAMARRVIRDLPDEGRQAYETTFAPVAMRELRLATAVGDFEKIKNIVGQYFYTPAGYEAALLLAQYESDRGQHLAAALLYQQLLETPDAVSRFEPQLSVLAAASNLAANNQSQAISTIEQLRSKHHRVAEIGGAELPISDPEREPLAWLRHFVGEPKVTDRILENQWLTFGGNAARNGQVQGGLPHMRLHWRSRLLSHSRLEELYNEMAANLIQHAGAVPVAATPLAVGDYIITRSPHSLVAVDFRTGKLVWRAEPQRVPEIDHLIEAADLDSNQAGAVPSQAFSQRIWKDYLYSSISSDGQRVYVIRDLSSAALNQRDQAMVPFINGRRMQNLRPNTNRLCAFELATQGKLIWEIDGAIDQGPFKDVFFLGAPLTVGSSLYCLAESKDGEVFLAVLDRETGELQWRQQLAELESALLGGALRKLRAVTPSYDAGMLICPTGAGAVIGIDLSKNALAWAYRYQTNMEPIRDFRMREATGGISEGNWLDSSAVVAEGRVILTPPESNFIHCIDLETGKLLWKKPREKNLFVASVYHNRVLVVGNDGMTALSLDQGSAVWQTPQLSFPQGSIPSGRGFVSSGKYYLPLSSAEVIAVDMEVGNIVERAIARDGQLLGNLICHRGAVISQSGQYLVRFDQIDVLRKKSELRLQQAPKDFVALRTLGEIAYNDGQLADAVELLDKAYVSSPGDLRTREVLCEALVVALDDNFVKYSDRLPLLEELHESVDGGLLTLLRLQARGLVEVDDPLGAFEVCLRLFRALQDFGDAQTLEIGRHHSVEASRWLRAQVAAIWKNADDNERAQLTSQVEGLINQLGDNAENYQLEQLCDSFGSLDVLAPVSLQLAKSYALTERNLEAQQIFMLLAKEASDQRLRGEAVAHCSQGLHQLGYHRLARSFDQQLRTTFADVTCLDDQTGLQIYESNMAAGKSDDLTWPYGKVQFSTVTPKNSRNIRHASVSNSNIRLERCDDVMGYCNVMFSPSKKELIARDSYGREFFHVTLDNSYIRQFQQDPGHVYGVTRGNLLIVSLGDQILAFDTLSSKETGIGELLWRRSVVSNFNNSNRFGSGQMAVASGRPGSRRTLRSQRNGKWIGIVGPLTHDSCIYQTQSKLVCVDSQTGVERWSRSDVPIGCDLYGDEQYVIAVPPGSKKALLFNTLDGRSLGDKAAPRWSEQLASRGREVIRWRRLANGRIELSAFDVIAGETLWNHDYDRTARITIGAGRFVAVVESSGRCEIIDAASGQILVKQELAPLTKMSEVHLLAGTDNFVLAIKENRKRTSTGHVTGLNRWDYVVMDGRIYSFDRKTGQSLWSRPAEVEKQAFMLSQPVDTPIIAFVGNAVRRDRHGGRPGIRMLVLEKASGRQLVNDNELPGSNGNHCAIKVSTLDTNEILIAMARRTVSLKFTDLPRPPEPPGMSEAATETKKGNQGLLGIGKKLIGGS